MVFQVVDFIPRFVLAPLGVSLEAESEPIRVSSGCNRARFKFKVACVWPVLLTPARGRGCRPRGLAG
eukprot:1908058-Rhodomonas_salina.1